MRRFRRIIGAAGVLSFLAAVPVAAQERLSSGDDVLCGAYCVYVAARSLGLTGEEFGAFNAAMGSPGRLGYSMLDLEEAARRVGGFARSAKLNAAVLDEFAGDPDTQVIARVGGSHFVVVSRFGPQDVVLIDPPYRREQPRSLFEAEWDGYAVVVSHNPIVIPETADAPWWPWAAAAIGIGAVLLVAGLVWHRRVAQA